MKELYPHVWAVNLSTDNDGDNFNAEDHIMNQHHFDKLVEFQINQSNTRMTQNNSPDSAQAFEILTSHNPSELQSIAVAAVAALQAAQPQESLSSSATIASNSVSVTSQPSKNKKRSQTTPAKLRSQKAQKTKSQYSTNQSSDLASHSTLSIQPPLNPLQLSISHHQSQSVLVHN